MADGDKSIRPVILCGPSGCGKSTLLAKLLAEPQFKNLFGFSVSHTTRGPRPGEVDGVAYNFTTREIMKEMINNNEFIEHAEFSSNMYGTSRAAIDAVMEAGRVCLLDIDSQGVKQLKQLDAKQIGIHGYYVFIDIPSIETLEARLRGRGTETEDKIQLRLSQASKEREYGHSEGTFDTIIVNDDLDRSYTQFRSLMIQVNPQILS